jgi:hypothetical protein
VLDQRGTRVLRGAGTYTLAQRAGPSKSQTFAELTRQRAALRVRTGAVRAGDSGGPVTSPNLWYVDVGRSGTMCLASPDAVRLWRPTTEGQATYAIRPAAGGTSASVAFPNGEMVSAWNTASLPVTDGSSFVISRPGAPDQTVTFRILGDVPADPEGLAQKLIESGCKTQLDLMSSTLRVDGG